jgi:hypothetical protein
MTHGVLRLPALALSAAALASLVSLSSASAAATEVHKHGSAGSAVHRPAMAATHAFHGTASSGGHRIVSSGSRTVSSSSRTVSSRRYGSSYSYGGTTVTGGVVGGGYGYSSGGYSSGGYSGGGYYSGGYGYPHHHSCQWYYNNEPNTVPSWCGSYSGASYGYAAPSYSYSSGYGSSGGYWSGGVYHRSSASIRWRRSTQVAGSSVRVNGGTHVVAHAAPRPGTHAVAHAATHPAGTGGHINGHKVP